MDNVDFKELALEYGHFAALGVSILFVLVSLLFGGDTKGEKAFKRAETLLKKIKEGGGGSEAIPNETISDYVTSLKNNWDQLPDYKFLLTSTTEEFDTNMAMILSKRHKIKQEAIYQILRIDKELGKNSIPERVFSKLQKKKFHVETPVIQAILADAVAIKKELVIWKKTVIAQQGPNGNNLYQEAELVPERLPAPTQQWLSHPSNLQVRKEDDKIIVDWQEPEELLDKVPAEIAGYFLFKRWVDRGKEGQKIIELRGRDNITYEDMDVESKVKYSYRVCAYSEIEQAQGGNKFDAEIMHRHLQLSSETDENLKASNIQSKVWLSKLVRSNYTNTGEAYIESRYRASLIGVSGETAIMKIFKMEKDTEVSTIVRVKKGETVKDKIRWEGKVVYFEPGWKIKDVLPKYDLLTYESKELMVRLPQKLFELDIKYRRTLIAKKITKELKEEFVKRDYKMLYTKTKVISEGLQFGKYKNGRKCLINGPVIEMKGRMWLLDYTTKKGKTYLYLVVDSSGKLTVYNPETGQLKRDSFNDLIKEEVQVPKSKPVPAVVYIDEKGLPVLLYRKSAREETEAPKEKSNED